jgi:hypothetical protein
LEFTMNTKLTKLALALGAMALTGAAWAQSNTGTAVATATVVAPLTVVKVVDMDFGTFAATSGATSVMKLSTTALSTGSTAKLYTGAPLTAAKFTVTGDAARTFSISYAGSSTQLDCAVPVANMPIDWTAVAMSAETAATDLSDGSDSLAGTLTAGVAHIFAGGNLTVGAYQPAGTYTGNFVVTVAYD